MTRRVRSKDASDAIRAAQDSQEQARRDLDAQRVGKRKADEVIAKLQAHNAVNNYDEWLYRYVMTRRRFQ